jgi:hypothetical protein
MPMKTYASGPRTSQNGYALISTLLVLLLMMILGSAAAVYSTFDLKSTTHFNTGNQAMYAAEAGLLRALRVINDPGIVNFNDDIVQRWSTVFGPSMQSLPAYNEFTYEVSVAADATNPITRGTITSIGRAPNNARRIVRARVVRGTTGRGRGAIYLAADSVSSQFTGNAFAVDGNDHNQFGALVPSGPVEPGIGTRNDGVTSTVKDSLNDQQKDNVTGLNFSLSPLDPSVVTTGGPSVSDLDRLIANILTTPGVVTDSDSNINGNVTFGTVDSPQITHMTATDLQIHANGTAQGAGILIVDGKFTINGTLDFVGWIIVKGDTIINDGSSSSDTNVLGNAMVLGSLWTGDLVVKVGGSAIVDYCKFCMDLANNVGNGAEPRAMAVTSWEEVL